MTFFKWIKLRSSIFLIAWSMAVILTPFSASAAGGVFLGSTTLLNSGDTATKIDIVFLGDGFTLDQQGELNSKVDEAVDAFLSAHPLLALRSAFNIHRVNVSSPQSGTDIYSVCGGTATNNPDQLRQTAMDTGYCDGDGNGTINRCMYTSDETLAFGFAALAPDSDFVIVLVNDPGHGGCAAGTLSFVTLDDDFASIVIHELGHSIFNLADEYNYGSADNYTGPEPGEVNVTIVTNRNSLKWQDLVLPSTPIPSQEQPDCSDSTVPGRIHDEDIVGIFGGAQYYRCDIFRSQYDCRMRTSNSGFCSVCRRRIIRTLSFRLGADQAVIFNDLLIRDDHDPWLKGNGEIYMNYDIRSNSDVISGRWPASGESSFDNDQSKNINVFAGMIAASVPGTSSSLEVRVREGDLIDPDDTLSSDANEALPSSGNFTVNQNDYHLSGRLDATTLRVLLDVINIKDDHDAIMGSGEISVHYTVSNGSQEVRGRWPSSGTRSMNNHDTEEMALLAAAIPAPTGSNSLTVKAKVIDEDGWFNWFDDIIGDDTFTFRSNGGFGTSRAVHVFDRENYRITLSVVLNP